MSKNDIEKKAFCVLVRLGIGYKGDLPKNINWSVIGSIAERQGLLPIVVDGIEELKNDGNVVGLPSQEFLLQWIGEVIQEESTYSLQHDVSKDVARYFFSNGIKTYVLKGAVVSECYPKPNHRVSVDIDCYLLAENGILDAWAYGNDLIRAKGFFVNTGFYKNSSFNISGVNIENHQFFTPFRGNERLKALEKKLQTLIHQDKGEDQFEEVGLYRPPVMVSSLFLIEHAYSHFLHEGLTWRHILDWMMFKKKHHKEINWNALNTLIDEFGFRKFYDSYNRLGKYLLAEIQETELKKNDLRMLDDVWAKLDIHDTTEGFKGKINLVGNTLRAWWKYHYFAEISMIHALWIQANGVLFDKNPTLD